MNDQQQSRADALTSMFAAHPELQDDRAVFSAAQVRAMLREVRAASANETGAEGAQRHSWTTTGMKRDPGGVWVLASVEASSDDTRENILGRLYAIQRGFAAQADAREDLMAGQALYEQLHSLMPDWYPDAWEDLLQKYQRAYTEVAVSRPRNTAAAAPADERAAFDLAEFCELIDDYQCAQKDGTHDERAKARFALMNACRAAASPAAEEVAWVRKHPDTGELSGDWLWNDAIEQCRKDSGVWFPLGFLGARPALPEEPAAIHQVIHQVWVEETSSWADVTPAYYAERQPSNRRRVYYAPQPAQADAPAHATECPHCDGEGVIEADSGASPCACAQDAQEGMPTFGARRTQADAPAEAREPNQIYVEVRQCDRCDHIGINDGHATDAACGYPCGWSGPSPVEDKCPGCGHENVMSVACPKCSGHYSLLANGLFETNEVSEPAEAREPIAWVTDDDRAITAAQKQRALADGGATASSVRPYSVPCYAVSAPRRCGRGGPDRDLSGRVRDTAGASHVPRRRQG